MLVTARVVLLLTLAPASCLAFERIPPQKAFYTVISGGRNISNNPEAASFYYQLAMASLVANKTAAANTLSSSLLNYYHGENGYVESMLTCRGKSILPQLKKLSNQKTPNCIYSEHDGFGKYGASCWPKEQWENRVEDIKHIEVEIAKTDKNKRELNGRKKQCDALLNRLLSANRPIPY